MKILGSSPSNASDAIPKSWLDAQLTGFEVAYSENVTGTLTAVTGNLSYVAVPNTGITVPVSTQPIYLVSEGALQVTTAGGGSVALVLAETTSGTPSYLRYTARSAVATNSGTGSTVLGVVHVEHRLGTVASARTFQMYAVQQLDTSSTLASKVLNSAIYPTYLAAFVR